MIRLPDWEARLAAYLADVWHRPHAYGSHDCALHGANAALAINGEDVGAIYRGRYRTELGAARILKRLGQGTLEATYDALFPSIATSLAGRGDLVMADAAIGVCIGSDGLFVGDAGLVRWPRRDWSRAWKV